MSVQGTGMGCPGATIVFEELVQLGCKKLIRVGTCGGLQAEPHARRPDRRPDGGAGRLDRDASRRTNEPHCPTASWSLVHEAVHIAKHSDQELHVGPIVSSDLFYNPNEGQYERWAARGVLAVEMEAAALFTVAALRGVESACLADGERHRRRGRVHANQRRGAQGGVDRMTKLALDVAVASIDACGASG